MSDARDPGTPKPSGHGQGANQPQPRSRSGNRKNVGHAHDMGMRSASRVQGPIRRNPSISRHRADSVRTEGRVPVERGQARQPGNGSNRTSSNRNGRAFVRQEHYVARGSSLTDPDSIANGSQAGGARRGPRKPKLDFRKRRMLAIAILLVVVAIGVFVAFKIAEAGPVTVTVNGQEYTFDNGTTVDDIAASSVVSVKPGDLVAVNGNVLQAGGGYPYDATLNGSFCEDTSTKLKNGDVLSITNGSPLTEDQDVVDSVIPYSVSISGSGQFSVMVKQGSDGKQSVHTGKTSGLVYTEITQKAVTAIVRKFAPSISNSSVAITFDDGPSEYTQQILDILSQYGVKATFFVDGKAAEQNPDMVKAIVDSGNQVAIHGYENKDLTALDDASVVSGFDATQAAIANATGVSTGVMRAPFMSFSSREWKLLSGKVTLLVGASIDSHDADQPGTDSIVDHVTSNTTAGDIIVMHDGGSKDLSQTVEALPKILDALKAQGLTPVTIDELLAQTNVPTE